MIFNRLRPIQSSDCQSIGGLVFGLVLTLFVLQALLISMMAVCGYWYGRAHGDFYVSQSERLARYKDTRSGVRP